jgi:hypothetical protein
MKKQYNITRLTDELQHSVFFQKPEQTGEAKKQNKSTLAPKHQVTKTPSHDSAKTESNQSSKAPNDQNTQELSKQDDNAAKQQVAQSVSQRVTKAAKNQSSLALKHFSSYLEPRTYKAWKLLATQREKRDYEILQEAVEQYLEREQEQEANTH